MIHGSFKKILAFFALGVQLLFGADAGKIVKLADGTYQTVKFIGKNAENFIDELKRLTLDAESLRVLNDDLNTTAFATALTENPGLVDAWKKLDDLGADEILRKNPGALEALNKPKFDRPNPNTYLDANYISNHLQNFEEGVTKIVAEIPSNGIIGPPTRGTFVLPKSQADNLINQAGGDINKLEDLLGLGHGTLGNNPVRVDINNPPGLRMPDGNEFGANEKWIPGGKTSGGILEATVDQIHPGTYIPSQVF